MVRLHPAVEPAAGGAGAPRPRGGVRPRPDVGDVPESVVEGPEEGVRLVDGQVPHQQQGLIGAPPRAGAGGVGEDLDHLFVLFCFFSVCGEMANCLLDCAWLLLHKFLQTTSRERAI